MARTLCPAPYPHPTRRGVRDLHLIYNLTRVEVRHDRHWFATIYGLPGEAEPIDLSAPTEQGLENRVCFELKKRGVHPIHQVNWHWLPGEESW